MHLLPWLERTNSHHAMLLLQLLLKIAEGTAARRFHWSMLDPTHTPRTGMCQGHQKDFCFLLYQPFREAAALSNGRLKTNKSSASLTAQHSPSSNRMTLTGVWVRIVVVLVASGEKPDRSHVKGEEIGSADNLCSSYLITYMISKLQEEHNDRNPSTLPLSKRQRDMKRSVRLLTQS